MFSHIHLSHLERSWYWGGRKRICHHHIFPLPKSYLSETNTHKGHLSDLSEKLDTAKPYWTWCNLSAPWGKENQQLRIAFCSGFCHFLLQRWLYLKFCKEGGRERAMGWLWSTLTGWLRAAWWHPATGIADGLSCPKVILHLLRPSQQLKPLPKAQGQLVHCGMSSFCINCYHEAKRGNARQGHWAPQCQEEADLLAFFMQCASWETCLIQQCFRQPALGWRSALVLALELVPRGC